MWQQQENKRLGEYPNTTKTVVLGRLSYLLCFILPVTTLLFLSGGPYSIIGACLWTVPFCSVLALDWLNIQCNNAPDQGHTGLFDNLLYTLFFLQLTNIVLMLFFVSRLQWQSPDAIFISVINLLVLRFLVATSSGTSGIVVAHEMIHRPQRHMQLMGRLLLCTVCYEHFVITHKRGHHNTICQLDDIATARLNESFKDYWHRVYVGYLRYAWQSEQKRLSTTDSHHPLLKNQVLHGLVFELLMIVLIIALFGWLAAIVFLYQAYAAVRILESVNYFQHWGLCEGHFGNSYGWVCNSWLTRHLLMGLSHHIGHHQDETQCFYEVVYSEAGPKLPYGYFVMNLWIKLNNASYQKMALRELQRFHDHTA